jgi:outer membrane lipase/esterase
MRHPRSPALAHYAICAAAVLLAVAGPTQGAAAEEKYQRLFVFGDSYADLTLSDKPALNALAQPNPLVIPPLPPLPPGVGLSFWRVYPVPFAEKLGIPHSQIQDIAVGGATASAFGTPDANIVPAEIAPGNLSDQVRGFLAGNPTFGSRDLVTVSIGGNDGIGFLRTVGNDVNGASAFGGVVATLTTAEIQKLTASGARNFAIAAFSGMSGLQIADVKNNPEAADAFGSAYFAGLQANLQGEAKKGIRIFMLDLHRLGEKVEANPSLYGLERNPAQSDRSQCSAGLLPPPLGAVCHPLEKNKYFLGPDGLHLTDAGFAIAAAYMANQQMAPDIIAVQPGIVMTTMGGFTQSLLARLEGTHQARADLGLGPSSATYAPDAPSGLGGPRQAYTSDAATSGRFTSYAMGTFLGGNRSDSADLAGYDYDSTSGTAGIEYSVSRNLILGLALNYTTLSADLSQGANADLDAVQGAAYLSYATRQFFAEALAAYGSHDIGLNRPGVIPGDTIRSSTDASSFALAARTGYLFDFGRLRAGPVAGLTYIHSRVGGYTEQGDDLLTFNVSSQTFDSLAANMGIRFLAPFRTSGGNIVIPHLNVLLEHQFGDHTRTLTTSLAQAPLLPIPTTLPNFEDRTYGRIEGGVTFQLGPDLSATVTAGSTFARDDGQDYRVSAGLNYRF